MRHDWDYFKHFFFLARIQKEVRKEKITKLSSLYWEFDAPPHLLPILLWLGIPYDEGMMNLFPRLRYIFTLETNSAYIDYAINSNFRRKEIAPTGTFPLLEVTFVNCRETTFRRTSYVIEVETGSEVVW